MEPWLEALTDSDRSFVRTLVLTSGSLKAVAATYGVSYPTVRARLDRIIEKVQAVEAAPADPFITAISGMVIDGSVPRDVADRVIGAYRVAAERQAP
ncbi:DUF2089 domain-containing protein [Kineococcus sp. NBC_00420]|uniref:DUF2089 family protein n=1 Tax=Kineococcus sp. NBC_00420 TaxID=2903564 RepID=UPI002E251F3F